MDGRTIREQNVTTADLCAVGAGAAGTIVAMALRLARDLRERYR